MSILLITQVQIERTVRSFQQAWYIVFFSALLWLRLIIFPVNLQKALLGLLYLFTITVIIIHFKKDVMPGIPDPMMPGTVCELGCHIQGKTKFSTSN